MKKPDFREFYGRNVDRIHRFLLMRTGDRATAEDLTADVFLKALEAYDRYDPAVSVSAWIYTIARNRLINHWRERGKTVDVDIADLPLAGDGFLEGVVAEEDRRLVRAALEELPEEQRRLIVMKHLEGYRHDEIAAILGKTVGAVKVATHRAMKAFTTICTQRSART